MLKDASNHSYFWSGFGGIYAWFTDQQNLMLLSLALGIITTLVNMYARCRDGQIKKAQERRDLAKHNLEMKQSEELHALKVRRLERELRDE
ncbi:hypothetical protein A4G18_00505 [Pasteurellaceae bacterium Pebbles2]|nr:hypothetical protein [Pasteurellaceae bacterium Pebbles2]